MFIARCRIINTAEVGLLFTMNIKILIETEEKMTVDSRGSNSEEGPSRVKEDAKENGIRKMASD